MGSNYACVCAKSLQSCLTLCNPVDCSPPGSSVHGILHAGILEWVAISFSLCSSNNNQYYLFACVLSHLVVSNSLVPHGLQPARLLCTQDFPGKNTGVGCYFLFQGSNPSLLHCRQILLPLSHWGSLVLIIPAENFHILEMHQMYLLAELLTVKLLNQYSEQVKAKLNKAVIE